MTAASLSGWGDHNLTSISLEHVEKYPVRGVLLSIKAETYTLEKPEGLTMKHSHISSTPSYSIHRRQKLGKVIQEPRR